MYAFIEGEVCEKGSGELILLAGGVGYRILCSMTTLMAAPTVGSTMRCHTILSVREDAMELYGFATKEEKHMFRLLTGISGVGPKMALAILGALPLRDLSVAIVLGDVAALSRAPGVGKKTAQRIVMELKDKVSQEDVSAAVPAGAAVAVMPAGDGMKEALEALAALGYSSAEARDALAKAPDPNASADVLIKQALRAMAGM